MIRNLCWQKAKIGDKAQVCLAVEPVNTTLCEYLRENCVMLKTHHQVLQKTLTAADGAGKLAFRRPQLSWFDLNMLHRAGTRHLASDDHSSLKSNGKDIILLEGEVLVRPICIEPVIKASSMHESQLKRIKQHYLLLISLILKALFKADVGSKCRFEILILT